MSVRFSSADRGLAQHLEAADSTMTAKFISTGTKFEAEAMPGGGWALFGGAGSPITHAVGVGMEAGAGAAELDRVEEFYRARGVGCAIDLCPLAQPEFIAAIHARPYRVVELNNILVRRVERPPVDARVQRTDAYLEWTQMVSRGFAEGADPDPGTLHILAECSKNAHCFAAVEEGRMLAGGAYGFLECVAWCFGDATLPEARGRGYQQALIATRLAAAADAGCEWMGVAVVPGTASHRNYLRAGFELLYMRVNVLREWEVTR